MILILFHIDFSMQDINRNSGSI